jgi:hypothetical protein
VAWLHQAKCLIFLNAEIGPVPFLEFSDLRKRLYMALWRQSSMAMLVLEIYGMAWTTMALAAP